jgi:hypothetical protein
MTLELFLEYVFVQKKKTTTNKHTNIIIVFNFIRIHIVLLNNKLHFLTIHPKVSIINIQ